MILSLSTTENVHCQDKNNLMQISRRITQGVFGFHPHIQEKKQNTSLVLNNHARQVKLHQCPHSPRYCFETPTDSSDRPLTG